LVLVTDADRGAGHISAVTAMLLGKPQIFSDVEPLADYLIDDFNGIAVPIGDVGAVAKAIEKLRTNRDLADRLGAEGRSLALQTMSDASSAAGVADAVIQALGGKSNEAGNNAASFPV
jgi:glycosyltransferase involved in cell wall biosynthesis